MKFKKILGWLLLIAGIVIISWSLYSSYNIFTGKSSAPEVFKLEQEEKESISTDFFKGSLGGQKDIQEDMKKMVEEQIRDMIPTEFLSKLFNLISWSILAGLLILGGSRLAGLGIKLIRAYN